MIDYKNAFNYHITPQINFYGFLIAFDTNDSN